MSSGACSKRLHRKRWSLENGSFLFDDFLDFLLAEPHLGIAFQIDHLEVDLIEHGLGPVGFVEDRDRSKGLYFVRYIDPEVDNKTADKGWLSRLKFWGDTSKPKNEQYQILVRDADSRAEVNVLDKSGAREKSETAGRILSLLYEQLK